NGVVFLPNSDHLVSAGRDRTVRLWQWAAGKQLNQFACGWEWGSFTTVLLNRDGRSAFISGQGVIRYGFETCAPFRTVEQPRHSGVLAAALAAGGTVLAGSLSQGCVRLWNPDTGDELVSLPRHLSGARYVTFSPDGKQVASTSLESMIVWEADTGGALATLPN